MSLISSDLCTPVPQLSIPLLQLMMRNEWDGWFDPPPNNPNPEPEPPHPEPSTLIPTPQTQNFVLSSLHPEPRKKTGPYAPNLQPQTLNHEP